METQRIRPERAVNLWKYFQVGLQFGEPSQSNTKQAALIPPYKERKKMDTKGATSSRDPMMIANIHIIAFATKAQILF